MDWHKVLTDKDYSEDKAFELLTSLSYDIENAPPLPHLVASSSTPVLYGKHMMKKYFKHGKNIERPDIQSEDLNLGIEVTRLIDENQMISLKTIDEVDKKTNDLEDFKRTIKKADKKGIFAGKIRDAGVGRLIDFDTRNIYEIMEKKIAEKIKLMSEYEFFEEYWLFMFSFAYIDEAKLLSIINKVPDHNKYKTYILVSAANNDEMWFIHEPYNSIEKHISFWTGGIRNE